MRLKRITALRKEPDNQINFGFWVDFAMLGVIFLQLGTLVYIMFFF